jgi:hypothetical protein
MMTATESTPNPTGKRRWVKPRVETVELKPTDDVLGACWASSTGSPVAGACTRTAGCFA